MLNDMLCMWDMKDNDTVKAKEKENMKTQVLDWVNIPVRLT